jgi:hypothetical protein
MADLERLDPRAGEALRGRFSDVIRRQVREQLEAPRLSPEVSAQVEQQLAWLAAQDEAAGKTTDDALTRTFALRRSRWSPLFVLVPPVASLEALPVEALDRARLTPAGIVPHGARARRRGRFRLSTPAVVAAHQMFLQACGGHYVEEDFVVVEALFNGLLDDLTGRDIGGLATIGGTVAIAWKGLTPDLALRSLSVEHRPALAYLLALRYRAQGWSDAERLWDIARAAPPDTIVGERIAVPRDDDP